MADWFYGKDGAQHGPVGEHEISRLLSAGEIDNSTIVWREGMSDWIPLAQVPEFQYLATGQGASPAYGTPPAHSAPGQPTYAAPVPTDGLSIAALICGILAVVSCYIWAVFGLPAVICGHMSLKKINNSATPIQGKGMAIAGLICGYLGILIQLVVIVAFTLFFFEAEQQMSSLENEIRTQQEEQAEQQHQKLIEEIEASEAQGQQPDPNSQPRQNH